MSMRNKEMFPNFQLSRSYCHGNSICGHTGPLKAITNTAGNEPVFKSGWAKTRPVQLLVMGMHIPIVLKSVLCRSNSTAADP